MSKTEFEYYYGIESEQYSFYRVPKLLIKDKRFKKLNSDDILLYGLMLDRMSMSMKSGWLDEEGRAYIYYTVENIMEDMDCSRATCVKMMTRLKDIGLIEKKRQGQGRPDIIYVKNFVAVKEEPQVSKKKEKRVQSNDVSSEVQNLNFKKFKNQTSGSSETKLQEVQNLNPNYTKNNNTEFNNPINLSNPDSKEEKANPDVIDEMGKTEDYREIIRGNIDYDAQMEMLDIHDRERYRELYDLICDTVCTKQEKIRINNVDISWEIVSARFLMLNSDHLCYVIRCLNQTATRIGNIRSYLLTALFNAPVTMKNWIEQTVQYDMFGGGWGEKGIT